MSNARKSNRLARTWARILGTDCGAASVVEYANHGNDGAGATGEDLLATIARGHIGWDEDAINAGAAKLDRCPAGFEDVYYAAVQAEAVRTVLRLT